MGSQGVSIDYVGLNNETDGALGVPRYIDTVDRLTTDLTNRGYDTTDIKFVAPDAFNPNTTRAFSTTSSTLNLARHVRHRREPPVSQ